MTEPATVQVRPRRARRRCRVALRAAMLASVGVAIAALTSNAALAAAPQESGSAVGVDANIQPGDDFFSYANGAWLKSTEIPAGKERWGARNEIDELARQQIQRLIDDGAAAAPGSDARKVADFRAAYLDERALEARGLQSLRPLLKRIDRVHDKKGLAQLLGSELRADVDPLNWGIYDSASVLGLSVEPGLHGEKTNVAFLLQGGLGLADRGQYTDAAADAVAARARYQAYIAHMLAIAGFDRSAARARGVLALETEIAKSHASPDASGDDRNADNRWRRIDFARNAPGLDWPSFFAAAGLAKQDEFCAWQPGAIKGTAALVGSAPLAAWLDYLRFHALDLYADVLPHAFAAEAAAFRHAATSSPPSIVRAERALQATQQALTGALGRMYAERYFPPAEKARAQRIVADVIAAFRRRVEAVTWLSPASKALALEKLRTLDFDVGYPPSWQDYSALRVDSKDAVGNLRRVARWNYRAALARLGQPADLTAWWIAPQTVGAVLLFQQNAYNFPAALMQAPKYDSAASDAALYGAFGAIAGHEVSHFVDTLGADFDAAGRKVHWWTAADLAAYEAATQPLVDQVSAYRAFADAPLNGKLTLVENTADLGGLAAAFDAYRRSLGERIADVDFVHEQDRQFFIGFARAWRSKIREDALRRQVASNDHAPEMFRIATVRNIDAWYEAFGVRPGQRLYLEPAARVRIW